MIFFGGTNLFWDTYNYIFTFNEYTFFKANIKVSPDFYSRKFDKLMELKDIKSQFEIHLLIKMKACSTKLRLQCKNVYNKWRIDVIRDVYSGTQIEEPSFYIGDDSVLYYASKNNFYCQCQMIT